MSMRVLTALVFASVMINFIVVRNYASFNVFAAECVNWTVIQRVLVLVW